MFYWDGLINSSLLKNLSIFSLHQILFLIHFHYDIQVGIKLDRQSGSSIDQQPGLTMILFMWLVHKFQLSEMDHAFV